MPQLTESDLERGLDGLRAGLEADGYRIGARYLDDGRLAIDVTATPGACADCLVPVDIMRGIAVTMLNDLGADIAEDDVDVTYPEGSAAH